MRQEYDVEAIGATRPGWSIVAIVGFVLSFLLILAPLGALLGIIGIFRTRGGRRRGRGLAIAAIPIGLVVSWIVASIVQYGYFMFESMKHARDVTAILQTSSVRVGETAAKFYDQQPRRFQLAMSKDAFERWLAEVIEKHGSLQGVKRAERALKIDPAAGEWTINFVGEFVKGTAHIGVTLAPPGVGGPQLRDISVDGVSAVGGGPKGHEVKPETAGDSSP